MRLVDLIFSQNLMLMKFIACLGYLAISSFFLPTFFTETMTLDEALDKGYVTLEVTGEGGYSGDCLKVKLENTYKRNIEVTIPAGQIFEPGDPELQNIMVAKEETLLVEKDKSRIARLFGFCVEAGDGSPGEGTPFGLGKMATGNLLKFALYLSSQKLYKNDFAQYAVWAVSDEERLEGIGDPALAKEVAKLLGKPEPQYYVKYQQPEQSRLLPGTPVTAQREAFSMNGLFYYTLESERPVTFGLYDEADEMILAFFENRKQLRGYHKFRFEFEISNLPKGKYAARMTSGGNVIEELSVEF